ncbi:MAG: ribosome maturation factor RimP [Calditrichaeota bacterium]|nr:MAG: ribosome maturation factor RimP [Calditrichota bacterium]
MSGLTKPTFLFLELFKILEELFRYQMPKDIEEIRKILQPVFDRSNVYLVDLELRGHINSQVLSVYVDTDTGITMDQIAEISREIEGILDLEDAIAGRYRLDVSSPGIDKPLTEKWQFAKNIGRDFRITYTEGDRTTEKSGTLHRVDEDRLYFIRKNEEFSVTFSQLLKAIVTVKL